jgi:hypothetical protein
MKVAFLSNKLTLRGTEVAVYDYAHFNETILGNQSIIITRSYECVKNGYDTDIRAYKKFENRFPNIYFYDIISIDDIIMKEKIDVLYIIKSGNRNDGLLTNKCKCVIHCVFELNDPHGDIYSSISQTLNQIWRTNFPIVPHMICLPTEEVNEDLRELFQIPKSNIVFGRYGGRESFDINFVKETIIHIANQNKNITFLFMNTNPFCNLKNVLFVDGTEDMKYKKMFINTCDAMIHARERGETFGLSCGEFAVCKKPIITFGMSKERNHIDVLGKHAILYFNKNDLYQILKNFEVSKYDMDNNGYFFYTPENVMKIFNQTFLQTNK